MACPHALSCCCCSNGDGSRVSPVFGHVHASCHADQSDSSMHKMMTSYGHLLQHFVATAREAGQLEDAPILGGSGGFGGGGSQGGEPSGDCGGAEPAAAAPLIWPGLLAGSGEWKEGPFDSWRHSAVFVQCIPLFCISVSAVECEPRRGVKEPAAERISQPHHVICRPTWVPSAALRARACPRAGVWRFCARASLRNSHSRSCHLGHSTAGRYSRCLPAAATCAATAVLSSPAAAKDRATDPGAGQRIAGAAADTSTAGSVTRAAVCCCTAASAAGKPAAPGAGTSCSVGHLAVSAAEQRSASDGP